MKYFTPELYVQLQNIRDEEAIQEWERRVELYDAELTNALPKFSKALKEFAQKYNLHDAAVLSVTLSGKTVRMVLQPDYPDAGLVQLTYTLWERPQVLQGVFAPEYCSYPTCWLYDEVGLEQPASEVGELNGEPRLLPVYRHNILLSDGWEIRLKFKKLGLSRPQAIVPVSASVPTPMPRPA